MQNGTPLNTLIIGTRGSKLALTQAKLIGELLNHLFEIEIRIIHTSGDLQQNVSLENSGEIGLFTRAIENSLLHSEIDLAVHSLKDLPLKMQQGLMLVAIPKRESVNDLLIISHSAYQSDKDQLPVKYNATIGTSSPRRQAQLLSVRDDISTVPIRGNIDTRINKLRSGQMDALVLAAAGVNRLKIDLTEFVVHRLDPYVFIPAPGQGALAIQMRSDDPTIETVHNALNDPFTEACVTAERKLLELFGGGCALPVGALVVPEKDKFNCYGFWKENNQPHSKKITCSDLDSGIRQIYKNLR